MQPTSYMQLDRHSNKDPIDMSFGTPKMIQGPCHGIPKGNCSMSSEIRAFVPTHVNPFPSPLLIRMGPTAPFYSVVAEPCTHNS